mmetsp:Transcript_120764/g.286893  ORF Transcript_120764/g.286893 Transcript_120764/m.286893 type:complete len:294 (-) Transcript_120764:244-1125(-)
MIVRLTRELKRMPMEAQRMVLPVTGIVNACTNKSHVAVFVASTSSFTGASKVTMIHAPSRLAITLNICSKVRWNFVGLATFASAFCTGYSRMMQWQRISKLDHLVHCSRWMIGNIWRSSSFRSSATTPNCPLCRAMLSIFNVTLSTALSQLLTWLASSYLRTNSRTPGKCLAVIQRSSCAFFWLAICLLRLIHSASRLSAPHFCGSEPSAASSWGFSAFSAPGGTARRSLASTSSSASPKEDSSDDWLNSSSSWRNSSCVEPGSASIRPEGDGAGSSSKRCWKAAAFSVGHSH